MPRPWYHYFLRMSIGTQVTMLASLVCVFCMFQDVVCSLTWCMRQCPLFTNLHQFAKGWGTYLVPAVMRPMLSSRSSPSFTIVSCTLGLLRILRSGWVGHISQYVGCCIEKCPTGNHQLTRVNCASTVQGRDIHFAEWRLLEVCVFMCRALYAPMHVLRLADQKVAAMDKVHF